MKFILTLGLALTATSSAADLSSVKTYLNGKITAQLQGTAALKTAANQYYALAKAAGFDYHKLAQNSQTRTVLQAARAGWENSSPVYEDMEGIVAGVNVLSPFDNALDAGTSGAEGGDSAVKFDLKLPNGKVMAKPGNLFSVNEQTLWNTNPAWSSGVAFDVDGDGKLGFGDKLPDANVLKAAADRLDSETHGLQKAADTWSPSHEDVFGALVSNVPTVGPTFFEDWKSSPFVLGHQSQRRDFVVRSRMRDLQLNVASWQAMYQGLRGDIKMRDAALDNQIQSGLNELANYVGKLVSHEKTRRYTPEQAELLQKEGQNRATVITGRITQAAALTGVKLQ